MGYPSKADEVRILMEQADCRPLEQTRAVIRKEELLAMQAEVRRVHVDEKIYHYIVALSQATREHSQLALGLSTRGSLAVAAMARALLWPLIRTSTSFASVTVPMPTDRA